ncbi:Zinc finger protein [Dirofilaria immitis]|nr:Zinc finger protein [Dirofilaria immitis]
MSLVSTAEEIATTMDIHSLEWYPRTTKVVINERAVKQRRFELVGRNEEALHYYISELSRSNLRNVPLFHRRPSKSSRFPPFETTEGARDHRFGGSNRLRQSTYSQMIWCFKPSSFISFIALKLGALSLIIVSGVPRRPITTSRCTARVVKRQNNAIQLLIVDNCPLMLTGLK